jgi:myo-inositol 2-dehydrogenase/D-chiro-inositol 1-dehydrogenase
MSREQLGVAVVGCGSIGRPHAKGAARAKNCRLVAVVDIYPELAQSFKERFGAETAYTDMDEALARDDVDWVAITTANDSHAELTIRALEAGKHVMVQKPMALTLEECDAMIAASERSGKKLMNAYFEMFHPVYYKAKELIDQGAIGQVFFMKAIMAWFSDQANWRFDPKVSGGGILMDGHIHHAAMFKYYTGTDAKWVTTQGGTLASDTKVEDTAVTLVRSDKALAELSGSNRMKVPNSQNGRFFQEYIELYGTDGTILCRTLERPSLWVYSEKEPVPEHLQGWVYPRVDWVDFDDRVGFCQFNPDEDPWVRLHEHFSDCIIDDTRPLTTGEDGRDFLEIILAGYESLKQGRTIELPLR